MSIKIGVDVSGDCLYIQTSSGSLSSTFNLDTRQARLIASSLNAAADVLDEQARELKQEYMDRSMP